MEKVYCIPSGSAVDSDNPAPPHTIAQELSRKASRSTGCRIDWPSKQDGMIQSMMVMAERHIATDLAGIAYVCRSCWINIAQQQQMSWRHNIASPDNGSAAFFRGLHFSSVDTGDDGTCSPMYTCNLNADWNRNLHRVFLHF